MFFYSHIVSYNRGNDSDATTTITFHSRTGYVFFIFSFTCAAGSLYVLLFFPIILDLLALANFFFVSFWIYKKIAGKFVGNDEADIFTSLIKDYFWQFFLYHDNFFFFKGNICLVDLPLVTKYNFLLFKVDLGPVICSEHRDTQAQNKMMGVDISVVSFSSHLFFGIFQTGCNVGDSADSVSPSRYLCNQRLTLELALYSSRIQSMSSMSSYWFGSAILPLI